jgi:DNA-binding IclR family transcriptional regulator
VARPKWTPPDKNVAARIDAAVQLYRRKEEIEAEYKKALAELADPDGAAVPIAYLAEQLGVERKTVYRHIGRRMT